MIINLTNPRYGITGKYNISEDLWLKHREMHPKRSEEALQNNLSICYGHKTPITDEMVEAIIKDEYNEYKNLSGIVEEAREKYEHMEITNITSSESLQGWKDFHDRLSEPIHFDFLPEEEKEMLVKKGLINKNSGYTTIVRV